MANVYRFVREYYGPVAFEDNAVGSFRRGYNGGSACDVLDPCGDNNYFGNNACGCLQGKRVYAKAGEDMEWKTLYPDIVKTAEKEGYPKIAERVKAIIIAEKHHAERYGKLIKLVGDDAFFKRGKKIVWVCMECGYEVEMDKLPEDWKCPSCDHPRANFRKKCEEF